MDLPNPFGWAAGQAMKVAADSTTALMLTIWSAGLWVLRTVLGFVDTWLTPDLSEHGPGSAVYPYTFWIAAALAVIMLLVQLGTAAVRREGKTIATALVGAGELWLVWCAWLGYGVALMAAAGGLTRAMMQALLKTDSWADWQPWGDFSTRDVTNGVLATVLAGLGLFLWVAAIGHLLVMLTRAAALLVLAAATPITAAGLVSDVGRTWFWKSLRWFHAAAFTPVVMVLVLGLGLKLAAGAATGQTGSIQAQVGTAIPAVVLICISCFAPLALFKLLAFVDPGTTSGAAARSGLAAHGGIQGLLRGGSSSSATSDGPAAATADNDGTSQGETSGESAAGTRFAKAAGGVLGPVGATGVGLMASIGTQGAAIGADLTGQMGVGHGSYYPDFSGQRRRKQDHPGRHQDRDHEAYDDGDDSGPTPEGPGGTPPDAGQQQGQAQISDPSTGPTSPRAAKPPIDPPAGGQGQSAAGGGEGRGESGQGRPGPKGGGPGGSAGSGGAAAGGAEGAAATAV